MGGGCVEEVVVWRWLCGVGGCVEVVLVIDMVPVLFVKQMVVGAVVVLVIIGLL